VARVKALMIGGTKGEKCKLHGIVNNAGIGTGGCVMYLPPEDYERIMEVNFFVPVRLVYALLPVLKASCGRIVNVASVCGFSSMPLMAAYNASKHAIEAYSDTLRMEMEQFGVRVSIIEPGPIKTEIWDKAKESLIKNFKDAPRERTEDFGEEWFLKNSEENSKDVDRIVAPPEFVAECVVHALASVYPQARYKTDLLARCFYYPVSFFPEFIRDRMLYSSSMKIPFKFEATPAGQAAKAERRKLTMTRFFNFLWYAGHVGCVLFLLFHGSLLRIIPPLASILVFSMPLGLLPVGHQLLRIGRCVSASVVSALMGFEIFSVSSILEFLLVLGCLVCCGASLHSDFQLAISDELIPIK